MNTKWERPAAQEFYGGFVTLRRVSSETDSSGLYAASHGSEAALHLWDYMPYGPFADAGVMQSWLNKVEIPEDPLAFVVISREHDRPAGLITIMNIAPEMGRAELGGIWYGPEFHKTAVNTEAVFLLLCYLFDDLGYRRVEWKCDNRNAESKRAAARLGFQFEGLFRQHMVIKGHNRDTAYFAIIDRDWPALRENFETYLSNPARTSLTALNAMSAVVATAAP